MLYSGFVVSTYFMLVLPELVLCCWEGLWQMWLFIKKLKPVSLTSPLSSLLWSPCRVPVPSPTQDGAPSLRCWPG